MREYQIGQKIKYALKDKNGKEHWLDGVIFAVKSHEAQANIITKITYLVDTGRHTRLDEYPYDQREREISRRAGKIIRDPNDKRTIIDYTKILSSILEHPDLPESKIVTEKVRQPEQIELPGELIRPR
jgi:hypothetical protein